jgi:predicted DNA-binding transcriptional regulator AlpA
VTPIKSKEVCKMIGASPATLSRLVKAEAIPCFRVGTGKNGGIRFIKEAVEAWIQRGGNRAHSGSRRARGAQNGNRMADNVVDTAEKTSKLANSNDGDRSDKPGAE